jgi:hypothetical protein
MTTTATPDLRPGLGVQSAVALKRAMTGDLPLNQFDVQLDGSEWIGVRIVNIAPLIIPALVQTEGDAENAEVYYPAPSSPLRARFVFTPGSEGAHGAREWMKDVIDERSAPAREVVVSLRASPAVAATVSFSLYECLPLRYEMAQLPYRAVHLSVQCARVDIVTGDTGIDHWLSAIHRRDDTYPFRDITISPVNQTEPTPQPVTFTGSFPVKYVFPRLDLAATGIAHETLVFQPGSRGTQLE